MLVRTNAQTAGLEQALAQAGVPFQLRGAERFFDRDEVRQAVGLLRAAARSASAADDPAAQVRPILASIGLTPQPPGGRGTARERWESLEALAQLAADFFAANPEAGLADLSAELAVRSAIGHAPAMAGVTLASLHAAKGLEWQAVFLPGLTDGTVPIVYAQTDEAIEEERGCCMSVSPGRGSGCTCPGRWPGQPGGRRTRQAVQVPRGLYRRAAGAPAAARRRPGASRSRRRAAAAVDSDDRAVRPAAGLAAGDQPGSRACPPTWFSPTPPCRRSPTRGRPARASSPRVPGVGAVKLDRYGAAVLELCCGRP